MNDKMWNIFEKTGSIEAFLYIEESKRLNTEISSELTPNLPNEKEKKNECKCSCVKRDICKR